MSIPAWFWTKRVRKQAVRWEGGDFKCLELFCGQNWGRADAKDADWPYGIPDVEQVVVFNSIEQVWLPVPVGWWIIRGINGELYPCADDIFAASYESVEVVDAQ